MSVLEILSKVYRKAFLLLFALSSCAVVPAKITTMDEYKAAISKHIMMSLNLPLDEYPAFDCTFRLTQNDEGFVTVVDLGECDSSEILISEFEKTIDMVSPLPLPDEPSLFDSELIFRFCRGCDAE